MRAPSGQCPTLRLQTAFLQTETLKKQSYIRFETTMLISVHCMAYKLEWVNIRKVSRTEMNSPEHEIEPLTFNKVLNRRVHLSYF